MGHRWLEHRTNWLRVSCSTNWANDPRVFCPRSSRENGCIENGGPCQHILRTFWIFSSIKRKSLFFQPVRRQHLSSLLPAASHTPHQPTQENAASHDGLLQVFRIKNAVHFTSIIWLAVEYAKQYALIWQGSIIVHDCFVLSIYWNTYFLSNLSVDGICDWGILLVI